MSECSVFHVPSGSSTAFTDALSARIGATRVDHAKLAFRSGEFTVTVPECVGEQAVVVLAPTLERSDALLELLLLTDALAREGVRSTTCVLQYLPYSRSNRVNRRGMPLGARVVVSMLEQSLIDRFLLFDLHARDTLGFFAKPAVSVSTLGLLSAAIPRTEDEVVVSPDRGRYDECVDLSGIRGSAFDLLVKVRRDHSGSSELAAGARTPLEGRAVLLFDDEIWTGQTSAHAIKSFHDAGVASVHYLTVYDFCADETRLRMLDELGVAGFVTTNLALPADQDLHPRYQVLDASGLAAERLGAAIGS